MKIIIDPEIAEKCNLTEAEALKMIAVGLYKTKGLSSILAAKILGVSEFEFHKIAREIEKPVKKNYDDLISSIKNLN